MAEHHANIISRHGKDQEVADLIGVKAYQVRDWRLRNSVPAEQWKTFVDHGLATLEELADAASEWGALPTPEKERIRRELVEESRAA